MTAAHLVGMGAVTSIGMSALATAAALRAGIAGRRRHPFMVDRQGEPLVVASVPMLDDLDDPVARLTSLGQSAAQEAMGPLLTSWRGTDRMSLVIALPRDRPGLEAAWLTSVRDAIIHLLQQHATLDEVHVLQEDHAGSILALGVALDLLQTGRTGAVLCGGVDSFITGETIDWLDANEQLHGAKQPWGFTPGEAAGFCLLRNAVAAPEDEGSNLLSVRAVGAGYEPNRIDTDTVCVGVGMADAWRNAGSNAGVEPHSIGVIVGDLNGDPYRGTEFGFAKLRTKRFFEDEVALVTPADCWGDVGAASGPLFAITQAIAAHKGYAPAGSALAFCGSDDGTRAAVIMSAPVLDRTSEHV
jgi:3-oxoacyl-[acyl-carrier-protein] synthase I